MPKYPNDIAQQRAHVAKALAECAESRGGIANSIMPKTSRAGWHAWLAVARRANRRLNAALTA